MTQAAAMIARIRSMPEAPYTEGAYVLRVLEIPGRVSGETRQTAIAVVQRNDKHYLCGPNRTRDWVRNLLAAGKCRVSADEPEYQAGIVDAEEGAPVLDQYLTKLGRVSPEWPFQAGASTEEMAKHWDSVAVFRLDAA